MKYDDEILYKLWLNIECGHNPQLIYKCLTKYGSAKEIYALEPTYRDIVSGLRLGHVLGAKRSLDKAKELLEHCEKNGIDVICDGDMRYPERLRQIYAHPQILYVRGDFPDIDNLVCVTIVGSRECSDYSRDFAGKLAHDLAASGIIVVSGMAAGIDAAAHSGALNAGNITLAVLAGGVDIVYPKSNTALYNNIIENGAVISERPPGTIGKGGFYKERNRILVGLSNGVVIAEGEEKSGTKLTATWATEANRDIFAVPGKPTDAGSALPNRLIKDNARLITSAEDIIGEYISVFPSELKNGIDLINESRTERLQYKSTVQVPEKVKPKMPDFEKYEGNARVMLEYLYNNDEAVHFDEISRNCSIPATELSFLVIQLLMERMIKEHPGEYYSLD